MSGRGVVWKLIAFSAAVVACSAVAATALGAKSPVTGAVFTTVNEVIDGPGNCQNGNPAINCNHYATKFHVWLNGGPASNGLSPNGQYFFAVLAPGGQPDANDGTPKNLSDDFDTYQNRTFTVTNGEVSAYTGTHTYDPPRDQIRLYPFADTPNNGGVYIMAVCYLGANGTSYPVTSSSCKYDAFKAPAQDTTPPVCVLTATGTNASGAKYIQVTVQDPYGPSDSGSGIEDIVVNTVVNANVTYAPDPWFVGTLSPVVITATKINQTTSSFLKLTVTNVAGLSTVCDPEVPGIKAKPRTSSTLTRPVLLSRRGGR